MTTEQAPPSPSRPAPKRPDMPTAAPAALDIDALPPHELYANREISWLDFNDRVFAEATDPRNPLRERVRFLAIAASNLDEFYAKRVGWLQSRLRSGDDEETVDGLGVREQLNIVRQRGATMRDRYVACWREELAPGLAAAGVPVSSYAALSPMQRARVREYFVRDVFPVLTPLVVDPAHPRFDLYGKRLRDRAHRRGQGHQDFDVERIRDADVVDQAELVDIDRNLRVVNAAHGLDHRMVECFGSALGPVRSGFGGLDTGRVVIHRRALRDHSVVTSSATPSSAAVMACHGRVAHLTRIGNSRTPIRVASLSRASSSSSEISPLRVTIS